MKKDILKEFVSENRDDFDDQEPGSDVLRKIQAQLGLEPSVAAPRKKVVRLQYWWAAAAIIVVIIGIAVLFQPHKIIETPIAATTPPASEAPAIPLDKKDSIASGSSMVAGVAHPEQKKAVIKKRRKMATEKNINAGMDAQTEIAASDNTANDWRSALQNESSSTRLAAILASGKGNVVLSNNDLQTLSNTMNNDENSNVRLAALEVLKKQENQAVVKDLLLQSVARQDDPVVQMELLASLSSDQATKVKQKLLDITQNPITIDAVRNQAYAALLRSASNF
ncbi:HEAT repeat domain-containing protein [Niabella sp.]|uniref:HEAT repeat domain-containing protein n=1 Tax=Niabella sp. TaxID=1962976 RepID=UPI0026027DF0|nr:HEAT repeat domain-containing protein [Niabella sp.]